MPIRNVVTRGFGNGTFSPGVSEIPVRGYTAAAIILGGCLVQGDYYTAGLTAGDQFNPLAQAGDFFSSGMVQGDHFKLGLQRGDEFTPGLQNGQGNC